MVVRDNLRVVRGWLNWDGSAAVVTHQAIACAIYTNAPVSRHYGSSSGHRQAVASSATLIPVRASDVKEKENVIHQAAMPLNSTHVLPVVPFTVNLRLFLHRHPLIQPPTQTSDPPKAYRGRLHQPIVALSNDVIVATQRCTHLQVLDECAGECKCDAWSLS